MRNKGERADSAARDDVDKRRGERRNGDERRGGLRWDPYGQDRRSGNDRRAPLKAKP